MEEAYCETQLNEDGDGLAGKDELRESGNGTRNLCSSWFSKINITIEPAICAIFIAIHLCDVVIINLILERTCLLQLHLNKSECSLLGNDSDAGHKVESLVQPYASVILTAKNVLSPIVPAVLSLFSGPWSDVNGRKLFLLYPMLGLSVTFLMNAAFSYYELKPVYFLLASLPFSFSGGFINLISAAYAYVSDISSEENRAFRLILLETSLFIGILIGMVSSFQVYKISSVLGNTIVLSLGSVIALAAFFYTWFFVQESVRPSEEDPRYGRGFFQMRFVRETFAASFKKRENNGRTLIFLALVIMTVSIVIIEGESNVLYLFTRFQFGWNYPEFMNWCSVTIACHFVGLMLGCVVFVKIFKMSESLLVLGTFTTKILQCILYGLIPSKSSHLMYWAQLVGMFGGVAGPTLRSVVSKLVPKEDTGKVFFLVTSFECLFPLAVTPIYTALYNLTIKTLPGAFFFLSASLYFLNSVLYCVIHFTQQRLIGGNYNQITVDNN